jgi:nicotinamide-nucleotide amidase
VVITVGDELLLGHTIDTNAVWLGQELGLLGIPLMRRYTVADEDAEIRLALREALEVAEVVICTGGLGPTLDDFTLDSVAGELGRPLHEDPAIVEDLRRRFARRGVTFAENNRRQARVPEGGWSLPNELGSAPGVAIEVEGRLVFLLPGVPYEMKALFSREVHPTLRAHFDGSLAAPHHRVIHTTGISESLLGERVADRLPSDMGPASVAFLPQVAGVDVRLTVRGVADPSEAARVLDGLEAAVEPAVAPFRFEAISGDIVEDVGRHLVERGMTVSTAESCTGGLIARRLTEYAGSSRFFVGSVVAYADAIKIEQLGVSSALLEAHGAVSREVAEAMALGACRLFSSDAAIGITGVAGPGGGTEEKPVGTVWYAVCVNGEVTARVQRFSGNRSMVRERSGQAALALLLARLAGDAREDADPTGHP